MFTKQKRLPLSSFYSSFSTIILPFARVKFGKNTLPYNRYGVLVTKKIDKRAVKRNFERRRITMCLQQLDLTLPLGYDVLVFLTKPTEHHSIVEIAKHLDILQTTLLP